MTHLRYESSDIEKTVVGHLKTVQGKHSNYVSKNYRRSKNSSNQVLNIVIIAYS